MVDTINDRVRRLVEAVLEPNGQAADLAVLQSVLAGIDEPDVVPILEEFFDIEVIAVGVYEAYTSHGQGWSLTSRSRLAEALVFARLDPEADELLATLHDGRKD